MENNDILKALLGKYVDKYKSGLLENDIKDLPDNVKGQIYQAIKKHSPDVELSDLLANNSDSMGKKTTWTVTELLDTDFPPLTWIVPDMIPEGLVSLAGRPKVGKSWMALQLAVAVASGGYFLGRQVDKGEVLYLALEDPSRRLQSRIKQLGIGRNAPITFMTEYRPLDGAGLIDMSAEVASRRYKLIVVDTFGRSLTAGKLDIKDYSDNLAVLSPYQDMLKDTGVTMLFVDHHGKMSGDNPVSDLMGSTGKSGTFDTLIGLYKNQGVQGAKLQIIVREGFETELAIEFDPDTGRWQSLGDTKSVFQNTVYDAIKTLVKNGELATTKAIADHLDAHSGHVSRAISTLLSNGKIKKLPKVGVLQPYDVL